ncbi:MAG: hypothetical protein WEA09_11890 [Gemmatimonadota bacterium]
MATKEQLQRLVDNLPQEDVARATEALERLRVARVRLALANAPEDDEPWTEADERAVQEAEEDLRRGERPIPMEEVKRRLGIA